MENVKLRYAVFRQKILMLIKAAQLAKQEIAQGKAKPVDYNQL